MGAMSENYNLEYFQKKTQYINFSCDINGTWSIIVICIKQKIPRVKFKKGKISKIKTGTIKKETKLKYFLNIYRPKTWKLNSLKGNLEDKDF